MHKTICLNDCLFKEVEIIKNYLFNKDKRLDKYLTGFLLFERKKDGKNEIFAKKSKKKR